MSGRQSYVAAGLAASLIIAAPARSEEPVVPPATAQPSSAGPPAIPLPQSGAVAATGLAGSLANEDGWAAYKTRFVTEHGRVVDTANGSISHSESQGYGMLLAVAAKDRATFERIWGWTRANLLVRTDELTAWRWSPDTRPAVGDLNNATDGDILIAWALTEAAEAWDEGSYRTASRRMAVEIGRKTVLFKDPRGPLLLPAVSGFSARDRQDGPLINLSYWIFPAFQRLAIAAPEYDWAALVRSGISFLRQARFGASELPTEWISAKDTLRAAAGFPALFSYNAIRIPLYMAWAGVGRPADYDPFLKIWGGSNRSRLPIVDTGDGRTVDWLVESGYGAIPALVGCAVRGAKATGMSKFDPDQNYYPATLQLLSLIAVKTRYPACLTE